MRAFIFSLVLSSACAHTAAGPHVNVAAVRHEILDVIDKDGGSARREIVSMGHVTADSAVVYTQVTPSAPRREETWVKQPDGWKLRESKDLASTGTATSSAGTVTR
ncbi:MAG: hypothetical protein JWO36_7065 [Myxococcales bacterium]|nr:hypothetical protein [Myxococcales bacterium]